MFRRLLHLLEDYWLLATIVLVTGISFASLSPVESLPEVPGTDKSHHIIAYAVLAFPVAFAKPKHWLPILIVLGVYSGLIEIIQPYLNRYGEWLDFAANLTGLTLGCLIACLLRRVTQK